MFWQFSQQPDGTWTWELYDMQWTLLERGSGFGSAEAASGDALLHGYSPPRRDWAELL